MACREDDPATIQSNTIEFQQSRIEDQQIRLDQQASFLCHAFNAIEKRGLDLKDFTTAEGRVWWDEHKKRDAARALQP